MNDVRILGLLSAIHTVSRDAFLCFVLIIKEGIVPVSYLF